MFTAFTAFTVVYPMFLFALAGAISPGPVNLIAASLGVLAQHLAPPQHSSIAPSAPGPSLQRVKELILDPLCEPLRLEAIADAAGLSRYHLVRSFKAAYGQTPHAFLLDQRINRGKQLLKRGHNLVHVAQTLGFADQSHFQRHFKHRHAVTPGVYQQALLSAL